MLAHQFILPTSGVYMAGHSLGPQPVRVQEMIQQALFDWQTLGVAAWKKSHWFDMPKTLGAKIAAFIGASVDEVVVTDSTVVNLFKVLRSALQLQQGRHIILTCEDNFPADLYIAQGLAACHDDVILKTVKAEEIARHLDEQVAVLMLTHVNYRDASMLDMKRICDDARRQGVITVWDLSHSVGIVPLDLHASGADFAVGCTYKYLSGGPGSPAFVYVNARHHDKAASPVFGWIGHDQPFAFSGQYHASGCARFLGGTPPILSFQALHVALDVLSDQAVMAACYTTRSIHADFLIEGLASLGLHIVTPQGMPSGGHVAFVHAEGEAIAEAMMAAGVVCDYRRPHLVRLCVNPLYLSLDDLVFCLDTIRGVLKKVIT